jgi:hypothetical protein
LAERRYLGELRHGHDGQNRDDGHDHHQFDQREAAPRDWGLAAHLALIVPHRPRASENGRGP